MPEEADSRPASEQIDATIANLDDWRGETFAAVRALVHAAVPEVVEEIKYRKPTNPHGVPVFSHHGTLCTGEIYKDKVKLTFASGASLDDPEGLFNSSLGGNRRRAIDIFEKDALEERSFRDLVRAAVKRLVFDSSTT